MNRTSKMPDFEEMISYRVSRLQALLNRQAIMILKENGGLSPTQWRILVMLISVKNCTVAQISRKTGLDKALLSRAVKGLVERELIETNPSSNNRTHLILSLTKGGRAVYEQARPKMQERHDALIGSLGDEERRSLFSAFQKLEDVLVETK